MLLPAGNYLKLYDYSAVTRLGLYFLLLKNYIPGIERVSFAHNNLSFIENN